MAGGGHEITDNDAGPRLLQIVNLNLKGQQYVVAGELRNLHILGAVCDALNAGSTTPLPELIGECQAVTDGLHAAAEGGKITLSRGKATIPLPGIDVPFHSRQIRGGVP